MKLTEKNIELITTVVVRLLKEEREKDIAEKRKQRYQNTVLLLSNYRGFVSHCEKIRTELVELDNKSIQDLDLEDINLESIESIKRSRTKTLAMVMFIQSKVLSYRDSCSDDELIKFRILEKKYLMPRKMTNKQIMESESIEKTTFYKYLNQVHNDLKVLFFGVDGVHL